MAFTVHFAPASSAATDLDDRGFVGGTDVLKFNVTSDVAGLSATEVRQSIQAQGLVPIEGNVHPTSNLSVARVVTLDQVGPNYYEGAINYRAARRPAGSSDENQLPWDQPASFEFKAITSEVPADEDADGNAIVNPGTFEPVDGITRPVTDFGITIKKNILGLNPIGVQQLSAKVNSDTFLLFPPGLCRTGDVAASPKTHSITTNNVQTLQEYYELTVPIVVREIYGSTTAEEAWHHRRKLQGYYELQTVGGDDMVVRALDDEGQPTASPVLLDADGRRLATGSPPVFATTKRHQTAAFNSFNIL